MQAPKTRRNASIIVWMAGAVILLAAASLPFQAFEAAFDGLMPDGDFETLSEATAIVLRAWLVIAAGLVALVGLTSRREGWGLRKGLNSVRRDTASLWLAIRPHKQDSVWLIGLAAVTASALALRLALIMVDLNHDEAYTVMTFGRSLAFALTNYHVPNNHILHTALVYFAATLLGPAPWAVRLPALLAGLATVAGIFFLGRDTYSRSTGLGAALLLALSSSHITYSTRARGYALLALFAVLAFWFACHAGARRNMVAWTLVAICASLGMFTIPVMAYPIAVLMVWLLAEGMLGRLAEGYRSKADYFLHWTACNLMTVLLVLALYTPALMVTGPQRMVAIGRVAPDLGISVTDSLLGNLGQVTGAWIGGLPESVGLVAWVGLVLSLVFHSRLSRQKVPMLVVAIVVIIVIIAIQRPDYDARIWFSLLPLAALWVSAGTVGVVELGQRVGFPRVPLTAAILALGVGLAGILALRSAATLPGAWARQGREEQAVLYLRDKLREGDWIVVPPQRVPLMRYYARVHGVPQAYLDRESDCARVFLITYPGEGQTEESLLQRAGLAGAADSTRAKHLVGFMGLEIVEMEIP